MLITDQKTVAQIKEEFHKKFPGLKIEFYKTEHRKYTASSDDDMIASHFKIGEVRNIHDSKEFKINPESTVAEIESTLADVFGLNVQIYRRSNTLWLQTSATDDWTLEKQNAKGLRSMQSDVGLYDKT